MFLVRQYKASRLVSPYLRRAIQAADTDNVSVHNEDVPARKRSIRSIFTSFITDDWNQIFFISLICHCLPGMYNALTGLGGLGQGNQRVTANATAAVFATTAATALFVVGPIFDRLGPRICVLLGGWTYPLHISSLYNFSSTGNAAFVVASGALLGVGASFVWVAQGAIITTYIPESKRGRAIALFWVIFNMGGGLGSLLIFGSNFVSRKRSVSDESYIIVMVVMCVGCLLSLLLCPPPMVREPTSQPTPKKKKDWHQTFRLTLRIISDWKVLCMLPLFFSANTFYPYQQNVVNGQNFNIRTRSLNGALYWNSQILGGFIMGIILDCSKFNRQMRARVGWSLLFVSGMIIWGGGYVFQKWSDQHLVQKELKQCIDFTQGRTYVGPMFLYMFYGMYDAFWQAFCYWLMGTQSNSPVVTAILVGAYKTFQSIGGAMAWRLNALGMSAMTQFAMDWVLCIGSLVFAIPSVLAVRLTSVEDDTEDMKAEDV